MRLSMLAVVVGLVSVDPLFGSLDVKETYLLSVKKFTSERKGHSLFVGERLDVKVGGEVTRTGKPSGNPLYALTIRPLKSMVLPRRSELLDVSTEEILCLKGDAFSFLIKGDGCSVLKKNPLRSKL